MNKYVVELSGTYNDTQALNAILEVYAFNEKEAEQKATDELNDLVHPGTFIVWDIHRVEMVKHVN